MKKWISGFIGIFLVALVSAAYGTVDSDTNRADYDPDGLVLEFTYDFRVDFANDLVVYEDGVVVTGGYSVTGVGSDLGGSVIFDTAPVASIEKLTLIREVDATQLTAYPAYGRFPAAAHEKALDKLTFLIQQIKERMNRTTIAPIDVDPDINWTLPDYRAGEYWIWDPGAKRIRTSTNEEILERFNGFENSLAALLNREAAFEKEAIYIKGRITEDDGGQGVFIATSDDISTEVTVDTQHGVYVPFPSDPTGAGGGWIRQTDGALNAAWFGGDLSSVSGLAFMSLWLPSGGYLLAADLSIDKPISYVWGNGWSRDSGVLTGSVFTGIGGLKFESSSSQGVSIRDFGIEYTGATQALYINNTIYPTIDNVSIDCNSIGVDGIQLAGASYFATIRNTCVQAFTGTGITVNTTGTKTVIENTIVTSGTGSDADYGIEILDEGTTVYNGQVNIERTDGQGVGIYFHNTTGANIFGGIVEGVLSEKDTGILVDGDTHAFGDVVIRNPRFTLGSGQKGVVFNRAYGCRLENPAVYAPTGGTVCTWGPNSIKCGMIGTYNTCRSGVSVDPAATDAYKICVDPILYSDRTNITTAANLTTTVEKCQYVGRTVHNGTAWDKFSESLTDDNFTTITPPETVGTLSIRTTSDYREVATCGYSTTSGALTALSSGAVVEIITTNGVLNGTTGTDGYLVLRASSTGVLYIENRRGGNRRFILRFE